MKLLFDENLPPSLVRRLAAEFPDSLSVLKIDLAAQPDQEIISYAKTHGYVIVSKDADFYWHCVAHGHPPKVIWVRCGNVAPPVLELIFRKAKDELEKFASNDEAYIVLTQ